MKFTVKKKMVLTAYLFILPVLAFNLLFRVAPIFMSLNLSFTDYDGFTSPNFVGFENYLNLFSQSEFWQSMLRTFQFAFEVIPLNMIISLFLALIVNDKIKGMGFFRAAFYLPVITPMVAVSIIWMWIYDPQAGILNYFLSLFSIPPVRFLQDPSNAMHSVAIMRIWRGVGWNMIIYLAGLQGISQNLYEAASIDGANKFRQFFKITMPLLKPVHVYVVTVAIISTLQTFTEMYVMTSGGPLESTTTIGVLIYRAAFDYMKMGYASAMSFVLGIIIMLLSLFNLLINKKGDDMN